MGNWQVSVAVHGGYLHSIIDQFIHLFNSYCNLYITERLHADPLAFQCSLNLDIIHPNIPPSEPRRTMCFCIMHVQTCTVFSVLTDYTLDRFLNRSPAVRTEQCSANMMMYSNLGLYCWCFYLPPTSSSPFPHSGWGLLQYLTLINNPVIQRQSPV